MPNTKSARKRARQETKRALRNREQRSKLKTSIKRVVNATEPDTATTALRETSALLDRLATRRVIHPNKAARKKSQLARRVAALTGQP